MGRIYFLIRIVSAANDQQLLKRFSDRSDYKIFFYYSGKVTLFTATNVSSYFQRQF